MSRSTSKTRLEISNGRPTLPQSLPPSPTRANYTYTILTRTNINTFATCRLPQNVLRPTTLPLTLSTLSFWWVTSVEVLSPSSSQTLCSEGPYSLTPRTTLARRSKTWKSLRWINTSTLKTRWSTTLTRKKECENRIRTLCVGSLRAKSSLIQQTARLTYFV